MQKVTSQYLSTAKHRVESKIGVRVWSNNVWNDSLLCGHCNKYHNHICLCSFLATGDSYKGLAAHYRMGESKIHEMINETCDTLWVVLQPEVMRPPRRRDWTRIEQGFRHQWHFPNCVGAVDGKSVKRNIQ